MISIQQTWQRLHNIPGGMILFSKLVGMAAPYTGTIGAQVIECRPGYARVKLKDRHAVRNHLSSVHAVALTNLGELATGLAFVLGLPTDARGIVTGLEIQFLKKARGTLTASCECPIPSSNEKREYAVQGEIQNEAGEVVARVTARWMVGPVRT